MKKSSSWLFLFIAILLSTCTSDPVSETKNCSGDGRGACSSHGGVYCPAGPDDDGSVICQDGWRNSSVSYCAACE